MATGITTEEWLTGQVGFELTDLNIKSIFVNREVTYGADAETLSEKQKDLCRADAYTIFLSSSNKGSEKLQDGNSSKSTAGESFTYRDDVQEMAIYLYNKWGETPILSANNQVSNKSYLW